MCSFKIIVVRSRLRYIPEVTWSLFVSGICVRSVSQKLFENYISMFMQFLMYVLDIWYPVQGYFFLFFPFFRSCFLLSDINMAL